MPRSAGVAPPSVLGAIVTCTNGTLALVLNSTALAFPAQMISVCIGPVVDCELRNGSRLSGSNVTPVVNAAAGKPGTASGTRPDVAG
jgi:hypothetical protein